MQKTILDHPQLARTLYPDLYHEVLRGYRQGFRVVFIMLAGLAVFSFATAFFLMPHRDLDRPDDEKLKKEGKEFIAQLKGKKGTNPKAEPQEFSEKKVVDLEQPRIV